MKIPTVFLEYIVESIEIIEGYCLGVDEKKFMSDQKLQDAVVRRIEIIGEAAKNVPDDFRGAYPEVPWKKMSGTRDKITHHYFGIDLELTFRIVQEELPKLKKQIKEILKNER